MRSSTPAGVPPGTTETGSTALVPPPGGPFKTSNCAVAGESIARFKTVACNCVLLTNVVGNTPPFQCTCEPLKKFDPLTASVKVAPPAKIGDGENELSTGSAFVADVIVKVAPLDVPPPGKGLKTVT